MSQTTYSIASPKKSTRRSLGKSVEDRWMREVPMFCSSWEIGHRVLVSRDDKRVLANLVPPSEPSRVAKELETYLPLPGADNVSLQQYPEITRRRFQSS